MMGSRLTMQKSKFREAITCYLFMLPNFALFVFFTFAALLSTVFTSFTDWGFINMDREFVGLENYVRLFQDPFFVRALVNNLFFVLAIPVGMFISLILAVVTNSQLVTGKGFFRTAFFVPTVTSMVVLAVIWRGIYNVNGLLNQFVALFGIPSVDWLSDLQFAFPALIIMTIIKDLGLNMVFYLAGLQVIPQQVYDAAQVDGAGPFQTLFRITIPCLRNTTFFVLTYSVIRSFQIFDQIYVMTGGGPLGRTEVLVSYLYFKGFLEWKMGYANAVAVLVLLVVLAFTLLQKRFSRPLEF